MKRNFLKIYTIASFLLISTSCSNLLEITETDFLGGDVALRTVANNESLLMGAYAAYDADMAVRLNGVFSDELKAGDFYNAQTTHEWQYAPDDIGIRDSYTAVDPLYRVIDRVNRIFIALPNAISETASDDAKKSIIKGEALFLRAFAHFELFRYYCKNYDPAGLGMIYMTEPSLESKVRENMDTYFQKLLADITEAKTLLNTNSTDLFRANRLAVIGLQARVALYMRNWKDAITYSTEFINAKPLASKEDFPGIWTDTKDSEVGFKISKTVSNSRLGNIYRGQFTLVNGVLQAPSSIPWVPSSKLWDKFDQTNDVRFASYLIDEPILAAVQGKPSKIVKKYAGGAYATTNENVNHFKVFRTGEMYLIRAEARAEDGVVSGANSAESDLNALRAARITGYTNQTFANKDAVITAIIDERFKELAFEGHRFWDLKRRGLPVQRATADAPTPATATLPANDFRFVLPIPNEERLANPLIQQNEGYN
ncbi:RagB/SusD family nutrient uptake outer membrane protein [Sphingobacterium sp. SGL-16]|uniref:RagB/SusD family nutrient uptake outer membrane protein n=1 Tax=Sphingobacterium sp. SGL-16 TaxID=2710883 RepID=UPI0013EAD9EE|nr:RagB/SusD family nutrient uptake outer membrane protein [Sphingobacterium sp. SGL-16]NGM74162.1 RagB/SusD family nutrient uptake outer membrane protein [Sphingobacterium sp. SGL-16]